MPQCGFSTDALCFNVTRDILLPGDTVSLNYLLLKALSESAQFDSILCETCDYPCDYI